MSSTESHNYDIAEANKWYVLLISITIRLKGTKVHVVFAAYRNNFTVYSHLILVIKC